MKKQILTLSFVFTLSLTLNSQTNNKSNPGAETYSGWIKDKYEIELSFIKTGEQITGTYFYRSQNKPIRIKGTVIGEVVSINEIDASGKQTGMFNGKYNHQTVITGTWSTPGKEKSMSFTLIKTGYSRSDSQKQNSLNYVVNEKGVFQVKNVTNPELEKTLNDFMGSSFKIDATSNTVSYVIYNKTNVLTIFSEGSYDYSGKGNRDGSYSHTRSINITTGKPILFSDIFDLKYAGTITDMIFESPDCMMHIEKKGYNITEDNLRISDKGIYFNIECSCGRGPCLQNEQPVIIIFDKLKKYYKPGSLLNQK
jgi:hypothetical protein